MKNLIISLAVLSIIGLTGFVSQQQGDLSQDLSKESKECLFCHDSKHPNIYQQWGKSKHYGANVGCYECHKAEPGDKDAFMHNDFLISIIVSPKDCGRCHAKEVEEFKNSHHSKAGRIMGSLDNTLAEVVEGNHAMKTAGFPDGVSAAAVSGCWQCHGSEVKVLANGKLDPATWPNSGIGRINPDGSEGSCTACHMRHEFSAEQARQPDNCGKCHMGPDHPQIEIYKESKHGIAYEANKDKMNMSSSKWVVGEDYSAAPTCATCHMSATKTMGITHNVGLRVKWNNRPPISVQTHETDKKWGLESANITGDMRRKNMENVCSACHNSSFIKNFYEQYEGVLDLYHEKFAKPGIALYNQATKVIKAVKGSEYAQFSQAIDYTWFELWHHEGRVARHGASMMGPDYTHWHGTYELAKHWNAKYIPELKETIEIGKKSSNVEANTAAKELEVLLEQTLNSENHQWSIGKEDPKAKEQRLQKQKEFQDKYK